MLTSLAFVFLFGLAAAAVCQKLGLPRIIGMLFVGILLGPYALNLLDPSILSISSELRRMALVIILIKAGLSLNLKDLKAVGRPALLMAFLPASMEILAFTLFAPSIFSISRVDAMLMGAVMGAVSPAVVVPRMVQLMEENYGTQACIPQMILAGASLDDVFVIVLFTSFLGMAQGNGVHMVDFLNIPIAIILGILLGIFCGIFLSWFFETNYAHAHLIKNSMKVIIVLGTAFLLLAVEEWTKDFVSISGMLAIISMSMTVAMKSVSQVTLRLQQKFGKLWIAAEVLLFVLVGAAVDIRYTLSAGWGVLIMLAIGLMLRAVGVWICMTGTKLNQKERLFCVIAYLPKATVQAAIGSVPLAMGLSCGNLILSVAVLAILITAPLGAIGMDKTYKVLLIKSDESAC